MLTEESRISNLSTEKQDDGDIRCPNCYWYFSVNTKPYILPCFHNLCDKCINNLIQQKNPKCPVCSKIFTHNGENPFQVNFGYLNLVTKILTNKIIFCKKCYKIYYWNNHYTSCNQEDFIETYEIFNDIKNTCENGLKIINLLNDKNNNAFGNENTLNIIKSKDELTIKEIKFCLSFALLNERLGYKSTALNLYTKAQENCFSRFLLMRKIKIFIEERNFKQAILSLSDLLSFIKEEEFNYVNKTPLWIDNIILKTLFEFQVNDIMEWLDDCEDYIWEYVKKIVNKYKYWIDVGQDIYLVK